MIAPKFVTAFSGKEVEPQKMVNFHRHLFLIEQKIPIQNLAYSAKVECNLQEIDSRLAGWLILSPMYCIPESTK